MLSDKMLSEIRDTLNRVSPSPWQWAYVQDEEPTDDPQLLRLGIDTLPTEAHHIQLRANGQHRFWVELTDTQIAGDVVFDFDFIIGSREWVPALLAEIQRLRQILASRDAD